MNLTEKHLGGRGVVDKPQQPASPAAESAGATGKTVKTDGELFALADLPGEARSAIANVGAIDNELKNLKLKLSIAQTARSVYAQTLKNALANVTPIAAKVDVA